MQKHNASFATVSTQSRQVKIDLNHTWRLRFLPVQLGPEKEPLISIAQHWWNKKPITCLRHTEPAWGGDPEAPCPICDISERLSSSSSEEVSGLGFLVRCNIKIRGYCIAFEIEDQRGNIDVLPLSEQLNPYEFDMFKGTWERFSKFQTWALSGRRGGNASSEWGLLDLETGCDLLATKGTKGITLDRCDPGPIFPLDDPNFNTYINKIWANIHPPRIIIPTAKQLDDLADKIEDFAENGGSSRRGRGEEDSRGRGRGFGRNRLDDADEDDDNGRTRARRRSHYAEDSEEEVTPRRTSSRESLRDTQTEQDGPPPIARRRTADLAPENPAPTRQAAAPVQSEPPPARRSNPAPKAAALEQPEVAPPPTTRRASAPAPVQEEPEAAENEDPAPPPPTRRSTQAAMPPQARQAAKEQPETEENEAEAPLPPPPIRRQPTQGAPTAGVDEEEDNVPEEATDPAPRVQQKPAEEPPPTIAATGPVPRRTIDTSAIATRMANLAAKSR